MHRLILLGAATAAIAATAAPAAVAADFNCRSSVVRVTPMAPAGLVSEPIRANHPLAPCSTQSSTTVTTTTIGPLTFEAANAITERTAEGVGGVASVSKPKLVLGGITLEATALLASAGVGCQGASVSDSRFVELIINGQAIALPAGNAPFVQDLGPLGTVSINEEIREGDRVTRRALRVATPLAEVVIGEAIAQRDGDACAAAAARDGGIAGTSTSGSNPCPSGSTYDAPRNLCVIREAGQTTIVIGRPFAGPSGGTVVSLTEARKRFKSACLYVRGPAFAVIGTNTRDSITGGNSTDRILLLGGNDRAEGGRGDDCIDGGSGSDTMSGALGEDRLIGRTGNDHLVGGSHRDRLEAGPGNDTIHSGFGKDRINGGPGNDRINAATAGPASVSIECGTGRDKVRVNRNERTKARSGSCERIYVIR